MGFESKIFAADQGTGQEINKVTPEDVENKEPKKETVKPEEETEKTEDNQEIKEKIDVEKSIDDLDKRINLFVKNFSNENNLTDDDYIEKIDGEASSELFEKGEAAINDEGRVKAVVDQMRIDNKEIKDHIEKLKPIADKYNESLEKINSEEFTAKINEFEDELKNIIEAAKKQGEEEKVKYNFVDLNSPKDKLKERIFDKRDRAHEAINSLKIIALKLEQGIKKGEGHGM